jgi:hypothetical protein
MSRHRATETGAALLAPPPVSSAGRESACGLRPASRACAYSRVCCLLQPQNACHVEPPKQSRRFQQSGGDTLLMRNHSHEFVTHTVQS